jgi:hypothetical protein
MFFRTQEFLHLILVILFIPLILQRLPYQRKVELKDIQEVKVRSIQGLTATGSLLTVIMKDRAINIVPTQLISEEVIQVIAPNSS